MPVLDSSTRERIVTAATALIMERGYEKTTMRAIADRAEVSLGSAYYYFAGKEELVQGFYLDIAREHHAILGARVEGLTSFRDRLDACLIAFLDTCDKYRAISDSLLTLAIVPTSPLNPFSLESNSARERFVRTYEEVIEGSDLKTDARLRPALPELLWILQLVVTLGWVQDLSHDKRVTRAVVGRLAPAIARSASMARLAPFRPFVDDALEALASVKEARQEIGSKATVAGSVK